MSMKERTTAIVAPLLRRVAGLRLPPAVAQRLAPLGDRLAPIIANRALVGRAGLYLVVFVALLAIFTLVRFPAEKLVAGGVGALNNRIAPLSITFDRAEGRALLGAALYDVTLGGRGGAMATADLVTIRPALIGSLFGRPGAELVADIAGGSLAAAVRNHGYSQGIVSFSFGAEKIDTSRIDAVARSPWASVAGTVSGAGEGSGDPNDGTTIEGAVRLLLRSASVTLSKMLFPDLPPIRLDEALIELTAADGKATVTTGSIKGPEVQATLAGEIALAKNISFSRLNLTFSATLDGELKKRLGPFLAMIPGGGEGDGSKVKLSIIGTVARPIVK